MSLTFKGNTTFSQSGPAQWTQSLFELDQLTVPYSGPITGLTSYLTSLVKFQPSTIDSNMLLSNWRVSTNKQYPEVEQIYIGAKGGLLPPGKSSAGNAIATAQTTVTGIPVSLTYLAPYTQYSWISTVQGEGGILSTPTGTPASAIYALQGTISCIFGSTTLTGAGTNFTSVVRDADIILIPFHDPSIPLVPGDPIAGEFEVAVGGVTDDTHLQILTAALITHSSYAANVCTGFHSGSATVVSITTGCGLGAVLTGDQADVWGTILIDAYFKSFNYPSLESEEIVPGRYWQNTQRSTFTLIGTPC